MENQSSTQRESKSKMDDTLTGLQSYKPISINDIELKTTRPMMNAQTNQQSKPMQVESDKKIPEIQQLPATQSSFRRTLVLIGYIIFLLIVIGFFINFILMASMTNPYGTSLNAQDSTSVKNCSA